MPTQADSFWEVIQSIENLSDAIFKVETYCREGCLCWLLVNSPLLYNYRPMATEVISLSAVFAKVQVGAVKLLNASPLPGAGSCMAGASPLDDTDSAPVLVLWFLSCCRYHQQSQSARNVVKVMKDGVARPTWVQRH